MGKFENLDRAEKVEQPEKAEKVKETDVNEQKSDSEKITSWVNKFKAVFNKKDRGEKEEEKIELKKQILQTPEQNQDKRENKFIDSIKVSGKETYKPEVNTTKPRKFPEMEEREKADEFPNRKSDDSRDNTDKGFREKGSDIFNNDKDVDEGR